MLCLGRGFVQDICIKCLLLRLGGRVIVLYITRENKYKAKSWAGENICISPFLLMHTEGLTPV